MKKRTHYEVLGVPRDAEPQQIKSAYREIAKEHHPDAGRSSDTKRFHEAQHAYEVLSDRLSREQYDCELAGRDAERNATAPRPDGTFFTDLDAGGFGARRRGRTANTDFDPLFDSILEELFGLGGSLFSEQFFREFAEDDPFGDAHGTRVRFARGERPEKHSAGGSDSPLRLRITLTPPEVRRGVDAEVEIPVRIGCPRCQALGAAVGRFCPICGGSGVVERSEPYTLEVPAGTPHGSRRSFRLEEDGLQTEVIVTVLHESRMR